MARRKRSARRWSSFGCRGVAAAANGPRCSARSCAGVTAEAEPLLLGAADDGTLALVNPVGGGSGPLVGGTTGSLLGGAASLFGGAASLLGGLGSLLKYAEDDANGRGR